MSSAATATATATASRGMRALAVLRRCARAPFRALVRARDLYVSRMAACAGGGGGGRRGHWSVGLFAVPRRRSHGFYRLAEAAGEDDMRELVRAASRAESAGVGRRSYSVAIGRIDEDRPCEFGPEDGVGVHALVGPRTARRRRVGVAA
ncbi:hypothetical protein ACP70R_025348 [Stipagrostis hirtigluma subsp. patula]